MALALAWLLNEVSDLKVQLWNVQQKILDIFILPFLKTFSIFLVLINMQGLKQDSLVF